MNAPFSTDSKRATTDVIVELSCSQPPPRMPVELQESVSPSTWENRVRVIIRVASQYSRPTFERAYLIVGMLLTFLVPVITYYVALHVFAEQTGGDIDARVWDARFISFGVTVATWLLLFLPVLVWKYMGKLRVRKLVAQWSKEDMRTAPSYAAVPVWNVTTPGMFRDAIAVVITVPVLQQHSNFHPDAYLPPYIAPADEIAPPYGDMKMSRWSRDLKGGVKYGDIPIYADDKSGMA